LAFGKLRWSNFQFTQLIKNQLSAWIANTGVRDSGAGEGGEFRKSCKFCQILGKFGQIYQKIWQIHDNHPQKFEQFFNCPKRQPRTPKARLISLYTSNPSINPPTL
jgi:hypothetical protein